jgi:hypothetical protein
MHSLPYTATARRSNIDELLDMVERGCRLFMRAGGGHLSPDNPNWGRSLDPEKKARIVELFQWQQANSTINLHAIAADVGVHYQTVANHTRHLRAGLPPAKRVKVSV